MAITISPFHYYKANIDGGTSSGGAAMDWLSDTFKAAHVTTTYTPDLNAHDFWNDVTNELASGNGYTTGGDTLASKTTSAPATGVVTRDFADIVWTFSASKVYRYTVIYKDTGTPSTSPLMFLIDWDGSTNITAAIGTWTLQVNALGLFTLT